MAADTAVADLKTLFKQSSHYVLGLVATTAFGFVSFPIFTRLFSVEDYGLIDFTQKLLLLMTAASKLGMQNSVMRFYDDKAFSQDPERRRAFYSTMFFGVLALASVIAVIFILTLKVLPSSTISARMGGLLGVASVLILIRAVQSILWSFLRVEERTKAYNITNLIMRVGTVAGVLAMVPFFGVSVRTYFMASIFVETLLVVVVATPLISRNLLRPAEFDRALFRASLIFGLPLVLQELFGIVLDAGDRGLVGFYLGPAALGFYSVAYGLSTYLNTMLVVPLGLAITPIYMRIWRTGGASATTQFLSVGLDVFLCAAAGIMAIVALVSRDAITLLASAKYQGADRLMPLIIGGLLLYTAQVFLNAGLMIHKRTPVMAAVLLVSAAFNVTLNCIFLPRLGLKAAAWATLLSYGLCTVLLAHFAYKVLPLDVKARYLISYAASAVLSWSIVSQLDFRFAVANILIRSILGTVVYLGALFLVDARVRSGGVQAWRWVRPRLKSLNFVTA